MVRGRELGCGDTEHRGFLMHGSWGVEKVGGAGVGAWV